MTDAITEMHDNQKKINKLINEKKIIECVFCWHYIKNDKDKFKEHLLTKHTMDEILNNFTKLYFEMWDKEYKHILASWYK